jgi:hypothetical protein
MQQAGCAEEPVVFCIATNAERGIGKQARIYNTNIYIYIYIYI